VSDRHDRQSDTRPEDQAFLDGVRRLQQVLDHPFAVGFLAVAGAAILFWLSYVIGETVYRAVDGDDRAPDCSTRPARPSRKPTV
jgi:hypothetical protein